MSLPVRVSFADDRSMFVAGSGDNITRSKVDVSIVSQTLRSFVLIILGKINAHVYHVEIDSVIFLLQDKSTHSVRRVRNKI